MSHCLFRLNQQAAAVSGAGDSTSFLITTLTKTKKTTLH